MFGRVENLEQLYIIDSLPENKIYCDQDAKEQLELMKARSENRNPPIWRRELDGSLKISYLNVGSLRAKMEDIKADPNFAFADIIIFGETWLEEHTQATVELQLPGYDLHLNSAGRGRGIACHFKKDDFTVAKDITEKDLQVSILTSANSTIVGIYRSRENSSLLDILHDLLPSVKHNCAILGDFNLCSQSEPQHPILQVLRTYGFQEMVGEPTHFRGGHIDMIWIKVTDVQAKAGLYSPYYTCKDHDCLQLSLYSTVQPKEGETRIKIQIEIF